MLDLILRQGTVIDPASGINEQLDVGIGDGRIKCLSQRIEERATREISLPGLLVVPGLIDLHAHVYWGGTSLSVDANDLAVNPGVTTLVDAGSAGPGNMLGFVSHIVQPCFRRIYSFVNLSFPGLFGFYGDYRLGELAHPEYINTERLATVCAQYPETIQGIKVRLDSTASAGQGHQPLYRALRVAHELDKRLMVHIGLPPPNLSDFIHLLRAGDILTHVYRGVPNAIIDGNDQVMDCVVAARQRGVLMDVGHGVGSMSFQSARLALEQGFYPDTISSDLHIDSASLLQLGLLDVMSRFLALGMPLEQVIAATTARPARALGVQDRIGTLAPGYVADVAVLKASRGQYVFTDTDHNTIVGDTRLSPVLTVIGGSVYRSDDGPTGGSID